MFEGVGGACGGSLEASVGTEEGMEVYKAACTPIVYLGGREEMKSQCELCKFCTVFHYWVTN